MIMKQPYSFGSMRFVKCGLMDVLSSQLLRLSGPHMSEEEGAEGQDSVAWLPGEM